jgi:hypothetical protein
MLMVATGCGGAATPPRPPAPQTDNGAPATLAADDNYQPAYGKPELQKALSAERVLEATAERQVAELDDLLARQGDATLADQLYVARADLAVRQRFVAMLAACDAGGRWCPPRLDDPAWVYDLAADPPNEPPVTSTLRFDLDSWRALADELHGRACACRSLGCVDSVGFAIDKLEARPVPQVRGDEVATISVTRARECLFRLRGKSVIQAARPGRLEPGF